MDYDKRSPNSDSSLQQTLEWIELEDSHQLNKPSLGSCSPLLDAPEPLVFPSKGRKASNYHTREIENLPEIEFLNVIQYTQSHDQAMELVQRRLAYLMENDDASKISRFPFWKLALMRSPAILLTISLEMCVGLIVSKYEPLFVSHVLLNSFIPVLSSLSGNIGIQASTTTLRALATGHTSKSLKDTMQLIVKELASALILATASAIILASIASAWSNSTKFGLSTGLSVFLSASISGVIGCLSPLIIKNLNIDPAVTAGPFETALQDMIGISLYLSISTMIL